MKRFALACAVALAAATVVTGCEMVGEDYGQVSQGLETSSCGEKAVPLVGSGGVQVGTAIIQTTPVDLVITVNANTLFNWTINELFIYVGDGAPPSNPGGWPEFTQFPYRRSFYNPAATTHTAIFPLTDLFEGDACGQSKNISIFVVAKQTTTGTSTGAWGYGENALGCPCYGIYFPYTVCCQPEEPSGCTLTQGYWKTHYETARNRSQRINWPAPLDENQTLCAGDSRTLLQLLQTNVSGGNAYLILAHQYIAAILNQASGASSTPEVTNAIDQAKILLEAKCGQFVHSSTADGKLMVIMGGVLDAYNNGFTGPGHCSAEE
jgi:hypothetical protein